MTKAVLVTKVDPTYDDLPENRYHFPANYLKRIEQTVGDWIIYYEPRRSSGDQSSTGGRQVYFSTARVTGITQDQVKANHYYAHISDYLEFDTPIPFKEGEFYYENALRKEDGSTNRGAFGHSVRLLTEQEYDIILKAGFASVLKIQEEIDVQENIGYPEIQDEVGEYQRPIIEKLIKRPFRDAAFAKQVKDTYRHTCAVTGIKIINGGGRAEVQAAHIMPISHNGPDSIRNGLALSGTIHWMFDRGLISVNDDYSLLKVTHKIPEQINRILDPDGRLILPSSAKYKPHPQYLRYHRENVFIG